MEKEEPVLTLWTLACTEITVIMAVSLILHFVCIDNGFPPEDMEYPVIFSENNHTIIIIITK